MKRRIHDLVFSGLLSFLVISCSKDQPPVTPPVPPTPTPVDTTLVAYYAFSGNALDSSSRHNDGQAFQVVAVEDHKGVAGQAYAFNGSTSFIKIPESASLDLKGDVTIAAWIYPEVICGAGYGCNVVWHGDGQSARDPYTLYSNQGGLGIRRDVADGRELNQALFQVDSSYKGKWMHLAGTYDTATNTARVYINGSQVLEKTFTVSAAINYSTSGFWTQIGAAGFATSGDNIGYFTGRIDEVRIYKRVLSAADIQKLYTR